MGYFFDAEQGGPLRLELRSIDGRDFSLLRRIAYSSDDYAEAFVVPADLHTFRTDLASVPGAFTWLVPRSGVFLPAAVLHDGLIHPGASLGPQVERPEADLILREASIGLGTGRVRAWLMWSAVTIATMWRSDRWGRRAALVALLGAVLVLGVLSTLDLFGLGPGLPWMAAGTWWGRLLGGAAAAVVVPSLLSIGWGRFWQAGVIVGVAFALLLHVTVAIVLLYALYRVVERIVSGPPDEEGVRMNDRRKEAPAGGTVGA